MNTTKPETTLEKNIRRIKKIILEDRYPMFWDQDIEFYLEEYGGDVERTIYELCCIKATSGDINIDGLTLPNLERDFMRIANEYRPNNSGIL